MNNLKLNGHIVLNPGIRAWGWNHEMWLHLMNLLIANLKCGRTGCPLHDALSFSREQQTLNLADYGLLGSVSQPDDSVRRWNPEVSGGQLRTVVTLKLQPGSFCLSRKNRDKGQRTQESWWQLTLTGTLSNTGPNWGQKSHWSLLLQISWSCWDWWFTWRKKMEEA